MLTLVNLLLHHQAHDVEPRSGSHRWERRDDSRDRIRSRMVIAIDLEHEQRHSVLGGTRLRPRTAGGWHSGNRRRYRRRTSEPRAQGYAEREEPNQSQDDDATATRQDAEPETTPALPRRSLEGRMQLWGAVRMRGKTHRVGSCPRRDSLSMVLSPFPPAAPVAAEAYGTASISQQRRWLRSACRDEAQRTCGGRRGFGLDPSSHSTVASPAPALGGCPPAQISRP